MMRRLAAAFWILASGVLCPRVAMAQCAMCGAAAASGKVGRGISLSIYFMLGPWFSSSPASSFLSTGRRETPGTAQGRTLPSPESRISRTGTTVAHRPTVSTLRPAVLLAVAVLHVWACGADRAPDADSGGAGPGPGETILATDEERSGESI